MNNTLLIVVLVVVAYLFYEHEKQSGAFGALGVPPPLGGADGSPASQYAQSQSSLQQGSSNSEQNIAHGLESAVGAGVGAGVCTYYGLGAAAPLCAKAGAYVGPKAVALGNFTTIKATEIGTKTTAVLAKAVTVQTSLATKPANAIASLADRAYSNAPGGTVGKIALAPVKIAADIGAKGASVVNSTAGAIAGGVKSGANAVENVGKKVLGWL